MCYTKSVIMAVVIHLVLAYLLSLRGGDGEGNSQEKKSVTINIVDLKRDEEINDAKPKEGTILVEKIQKEKEKIKEPECKDFFYGIGIARDIVPCRVTQVYAGYPAAKHGIKVGDVIVEPECWNIIGDEGTTVNLKLIRDGQLINMSIKRGKICGTK